jgi:hypothetical protein
VPNQLYYHARNPGDVFYGIYAADLCQRYTALGVRETTCTVDYMNSQANASSLYNDADLALQMRPGRPFIIDPIPEQAAAAGQAVLTVDLTRIYKLHSVETWFYGPSRDPNSISLSTSEDGSSWSTLGSLTRYWTDNWRIMGSSRAARYLRFTFTGFRGADWRLYGFRAFADAFNNEALFDNEGLSLWDSAYIRSGTATPWGELNIGQNLRQETYENHFRVLQYAAGATGKTEDAKFALTWTQPLLVDGVRFAFRDFGSTGLDAWQNGAAILYTPLGGSPTEVWSTTDPVTSDTVAIFEDPVETHRLEVVNKYGTYPAGSKSFATFGATGTDIAGQTGTGTGALHRLHVISRNALSAPTPHFTVDVPLSGHLSVGLVDPATGALTAALIPGAQVEPGIKEFWWDKFQLFAPFTATTSVSRKPVALFSRATVTPLQGVAHHNLAGSQSAVSALNAAPGSVASLHFDADGNLYIGQDFEENGYYTTRLDPVAGTIAWRTNATSNYAYALTTDATYLYLIRADGSDHLLQRLSRSAGTGLTTLATLSTEDSRTPRYTGIAAEPSGNLFLLDSINSQLSVYTKAGSLVDADAVTGLTSSRGLCLDPRGGGVWIAAGSTIKRYPYDESYVFSAADVEITGLGQPASPCVFERAAGEYSLVYFDRTSGQVREYDVTSTPSSGGTRDGQLGYRDRLDDFDITLPQFVDVGRFAVNPSTGGYAYYDTSTRTTAVFGGDNSLLLKASKEFQGSVRWNPEGITGNTAKIVTGIGEYRLALDGSTLEGGWGDGTWLPTRSTFPPDFKFATRDQSSTNLLTLQTPWGPIPYLYHASLTRGVNVWQIMPDGSLRHCASVGLGHLQVWPGVNSEFDAGSSTKSRWLWSDDDGDGVIDVAPGSSASPQGEVRSFTSGSPFGYSAPKFDEKGVLLNPNVTYGSLTNALVMFPPRFELVSGSDPIEVNPHYSYDRQSLTDTPFAQQYVGPVAMRYSDVAGDSKGGAAGILKSTDDSVSESYAVRVYRDGTRYAMTQLLYPEGATSYNVWVESDPDGPEVGAWGAKGMTTDPLYARLQHPNATDFDFDSDEPWSVELNFLCQHSSGTGILWGKYDPDLTRGYFVAVTASRGLFVAVRNTTTSDDLSVTAAAGTLPLNELRQILVTYDGSRTPAGLKIYRNGEAVSTSTSSNTLTGTTLNSVPLVLMRRLGNVDGVQGVLGQVRTWDRELSGAEAAELYESGVIQRYDDLSSGLQSGAIADWPLDDAVPVAERANLLMPSKPLADSGLVPAPLPVREASQADVEPAGDLLYEVYSQNEGRDTAGNTGWGSAYFVREVTTGLPILSFSSGSNWRQPNHPWASGWQDTPAGFHILKASDATRYMAALHVAASAYAIFRLDGLHQYQYLEGDPIVWSDRYTVDSGGNQSLEVEWPYATRAGLFYRHSAQLRI